MSKKPSPSSKTDKKVERTNTGKRGAKKNPQTGLANVLLGKGQLKKMKHVPGMIWKGSEHVAVPFDEKQSKINKELGYW